MTDSATRCPHCQAAVPPGADVCPSCGTPLGPPGPTPPMPAGGPRPPHSDLGRRIDRLRQWREVAAPLGVDVPAIPRWVDVRARRGPSDDWEQVVEGVERTATKTLRAFLADWERRSRVRLDRLASYSVDGRLERIQIEEAVALAKGGDLGRALGSFQQVERVVSLKERHLEQARAELEQLVTVLRDMQTLDLSPPHEPAKVAERLDADLRKGRLAALKEELRTLRAEAVRRLKARLPPYVTEYGNFLARERVSGASVDREAVELALAARAFSSGHPEEALRRLRLLSETHPFVRRPRPPPGEGRTN